MTIMLKRLLRSRMIFVISDFYKYLNSSDSSSKLLYVFFIFHSLTHIATDQVRKRYISMVFIFSYSDLCTTNFRLVKGFVSGLCRNENLKYIMVAKVLYKHPDWQYPLCTTNAWWISKYHIIWILQIYSYNTHSDFLHLLSKKWFFNIFYDFFGEKTDKTHR